MKTKTRKKGGGWFKWPENKPLPTVPVLWEKKERRTGKTEYRSGYVGADRLPYDGRVENPIQDWEFEITCWRYLKEILND